MLNIFILFLGLRSVLQQFLVSQQWPREDTTCTIRMKARSRTRAHWSSTAKRWRDMTWKEEIHTSRCNIEILAHRSHRSLRSDLIRSRMLRRSRLVESRLLLHTNLITRTPSGLKSLSAGWILSTTTRTLKFAWSIKTLVVQVGTCDHLRIIYSLHIFSTYILYIYSLNTLLIQSTTLPQFSLLPDFREVRKKLSREIWKL